MDGTDARSGRRLGRFFLASELDAEPQLEEDDLRHLARVLRARVGDRLEGVDGRGGRVELEVRAVDRRRVELVRVGPARREPPPGATDALLPAIELACAPPRPTRLEPMLDRLGQLGVARIRLLACARTGPEDRRPRPDRLARVLRESLKQSGVAWLPELEGPVPLAEFTPGAPSALVCDPRGSEGLWAALAERRGLLAARTRAPAVGRPTPALTLVVGPEGGLAPEEQARLEALGVRPVRLGPSVLRIETAAELAVGAAVLAASATDAG